MLTALQNCNCRCNTWNRLSQTFDLQNWKCTANSYSFPNRNIILDFGSMFNSWKEIIASCVGRKAPQPPHAFLTVGMRQSPMSLLMGTPRATSVVPQSATGYGKSQRGHYNAAGGITGGPTHRQCPILALREQCFHVCSYDFHSKLFQLSFCQHPDSTRYFSMASQLPSVQV